VFSAGHLILAFALGAAAAALVAWGVSMRWVRRHVDRQRHLMRRTRRAERLAELGTLTSHLMHEIRNPLSTIKVNLQLLTEDMAQEARRAAPGAGPGELEPKFQRQMRKLSTITKEAERLAETLSDFGRYAGRMEVHRVRTDVNEILDDVIDFYEPQAVSKGVQMRRSLGAAPAQCSVDERLFKQAVLNLFINAVQAMENGGELIVRTQTRADEVQIDVIDTGPGIPPENQAKVFDAYYTTRPGGTGLGLAICRRIIEEMDGRIELHSEPGKGSDFTLVLPLAASPPTVAETNVNTGKSSE
jgi:signal transduction histidine kinase